MNGTGSFERTHTEVRIVEHDGDVIGKLKIGLSERILIEVRIERENAGACDGQENEEGKRILSENHRCQFLVQFTTNERNRSVGNIPHIAIGQQANEQSNEQWQDVAHQQAVHVDIQLNEVRVAGRARHSAGRQRCLMPVGDQTWNGYEHTDDK